MSEKKETVPEVAELTRKKGPDANDEYYVPDYVMRDFGETKEVSSSAAWASGRRSSAGIFL